MRRFRAGSGAEWDVVLGRASWGSLYALFVPVGRDEDVRQAPFTPGSLQTAEAELDALAPAQLQALLERSTPKED